MIRGRRSLGPLLALALVAGTVLPVAASRPTPPVTEPFLAFMVRLVVGDSLGTWSGDEIRVLSGSGGARSRFPLEMIRSVVRRPVGPDEFEARGGAVVGRIWEIELSGAVARPLPYSFLGYRPGSLEVARRLVLSEWRVGELTVGYRDRRGEPRERTAHDVTVLRLDEGYLFLDVDAVVDKLLGTLLDDSWSLGLVLFREPRHWTGVAVNLGRGGQRIFGEMDLAADEIRPRGRRFAAAISRVSRRWMRPRGGGPFRGWDDGPP